MNTSPFAQLHNDLTDHVTGLPRYAVALVEIPHLSRALEKDRSLGVIAFAALADAGLYRLTPEAAQRLRADISHRLGGLLRPKDRLYTVSHWEWLAVLPDLPSSASLVLAMMKLQGSFIDPVTTLDGNALPLRVVCGGAVWPDDGDNALHLIQSARIARWSADRDGNDYAIYSRDMENVNADQQSLHTELQHAFGSGGLSLHLQPQIDLASRSCIGCEALLRWQRQNGEWVPPPHTLAAVERLGLRNTFTRWLLQQAMQIQNRLAAAGVDILLSINLSASDLLDSELPDLIAQSLATWDVAPERILLELTETLMVEETQQVVDVLQQLRSQGLALSIDDFGTGYAGMSYLQRLPVQEVKIDQSFVRHAVDSERNREIIASVVRLAHRLKMGVVAEGVETAEIASAVAELGCERAQGFLYTPALPVDKFIAWWQAHQAQLPTRTGRPVRKPGRPRKAGRPPA